MIIPDHEIIKLLKEGKIVVEPLEDGQIKSACIDLKLGSEFKIFRHTQEACIDSRKPDQYIEDIFCEKDGIILHPGEFILGITKEKIKLPDDIAGYVDGRSSIGRLGVTAHITSAWIDPGFEGRLVLEITNLGKMPVRLFPDMGIAKILFFRLSSPTEVPYSKRKDAKYNKQDVIEESRLHEEWNR